MLRSVRYTPGRNNVGYQEEYNVVNFTNLDDIGQPYTCSAWGNQGSLNDNLITPLGISYLANP